MTYLFDNHTYIQQLHQRIRPLRHIHGFHTHLHPPHTTPLYNQPHSCR